ncbi:DUF5074 domain-containing protein [Chitinophaga nivalis]|uniref:DUF5074 domain-containing protein n=1 Tax=Chitinophaga nivalis TaxID=2991709 RepID=A0ABT3IPV2_9BACT|nr:DUF5074 domain-containing protein [Chitinophaga nivalis]MCW3464479.1 DUF5074 domain-containing protein [Chitinophaga nivalis]MCW3485830.1 DUF5074 domain-containing protein [Chitinophaga nivalis]
MKKSVLALGALIAVVTVSCSKKDNTELLPVEVPAVAIVNVLSQNTVAQEDTLIFKVKAVQGSTFAWSVDGKDAGVQDTIFKFVSDDLGEHTVKVIASGKDKQVSAQTSIAVHGKYKYGTFVLNEGNMTTENGTLTFISAGGVVTDSAYFKANGTQLGNVAQDLYIHRNKLYIISQNGKKNAVGNTFDNDGMLIVANAETLKKEAAYNDELATLSWPSHVAVLNEENIIIRDNNGLYRFNPLTRALTFIKGSRSAAKLTLAVSNNKLFAAAGSKVYVVEADKDTLTYALDMKASVSGVLKANDGNIWVSTTGAPAKISKINFRDYSLIKANEITAGSVSAGFGATPGITAKGDTLYFSGAGTKIYRHIFSLGSTEFMVDAKTKVENANIVYNNIAVHPLTGEVYLNTIKGYGWNYLVNNISAFNFNEGVKVSANYKNYTNFPAGIFFTYSFN